MIDQYASNGEMLETGHDMIDTYTWSSVQYIDPDNWEHRYVVGERWYRINGQEVSQEVFDRRLRERKNHEHL